jgi:hypothetical protein
VAVVLKTARVFEMLSVHADVDAALLSISSEPMAD